jgi:shikimate kinase
MAEQGQAVILIGFMGAGKSCVGVELCRRTRLPAFDTDAMVVSRMQSSISDIFDRLGEDAFRNEESAALRAIPHGACVVVTGGGCILREENVDVMRGLGTVVWLHADMETIFRRIAHREDRPLLRGGDPRKRIAELLAKREELYREAAEIVIDTSARTPADIAEAIINELPHLQSACAAHQS